MNSLFTTYVSVSIKKVPLAVGQQKDIVLTSNCKSFFSWGFFVVFPLHFCVKKVEHGNMNQTARAALPQSPYKKFTLKPSHIKYYGPIFVFLIMIAAIKVFLNYATIQTSIQQIKKETQMIQRRTQYEGLQKYMYSRPESQVFMAHDNGVLLEKERIIVNMRFDTAVISGAQLSGATTS
jgi:hypothetical protein